MTNEAHSFTLKDTMNEIHRICPDVKNVFMFKENGEIIATDDNTPEKTVIHSINALESVLTKAEVLGGLESIILDDGNGRLNVSGMSGLYLVTVTSKKADLDYVNDITHALIPTVLRLLEKTNPAPLKNNLSGLKTEHEISALKPTEILEEEQVEETAAEEQEEEPEAEPIREPTFPRPHANQFIVENARGLFVPSDTIRVDNSVLSKWMELYKDKRIEQAEIVTFGGKSVRCKIKPIKDSKRLGKGEVHMPQKIQATLGTKKGELVRVKPVIE